MQKVQLTHAQPDNNLVTNESRVGRILINGEQKSSADGDEPWAKDHEIVVVADNGDGCASEDGTNNNGQHDWKTCRQRLAQIPRTDKLNIHVDTTSCR